MKSKHSTVRFANGVFIYAADGPVPCIAAKNALHGDLKSPKIRMIEKGQQCQLIRIWYNYYGQQARIKFEGGVIDVNPSDLIFNATVNNEQ